MNMKIIFILMPLLLSSCALSEKNQYLMNTNPKVFIVSPLSDLLNITLTPENKINFEKESNIEGYSWINKK